MMFVPVWLIFFGTGTLMAVCTVAWSIKTRQFDDQDRARYLPFSGLSPEELKEKPPVRRGPGFFAIMFVMFLGLSSIVLCLALVIRHAG